MKKQVIAALVLVAAAIGAAAPSWAFQSVQKTTVTAGTFVGGSRIARFTLTIRDTSNPFGTNRSSVTWSNISSGQGWTMADRLLVLNSTVTDANGGVQIYTENTAADAVPQFVDPTPAVKTNPDSAAAGLLQGNSGTTSTVLPVAWSIKSSTKQVGGGNPATGIGAADPNGNATGAANSSQWLFLTDRYDDQGIDYNNNGNVTDPGDAAPFVDGMVYISMVRVGGIHTGQSDTDIEGRADGLDSYVYFEANFQNAAAQTAYQTTAMRVEAFIQ